MIFPNLGIIQVLLQTLNEIFQNTKKLTKFMVIKVLYFSTISMSSIIGISQVSKFFFKYNHLQPPDAAGFRRVDVILS